MNEKQTSPGKNSAVSEYSAAAGFVQLLCCSSCARVTSSVMAQYARLLATNLMLMSSCVLVVTSATQQNKENAQRKQNKFSIDANILQCSKQHVILDIMSRQQLSAVWVLLVDNHGNHNNLHELIHCACKQLAPCVLFAACVCRVHCFDSEMNSRT